MRPVACIAGGGREQSRQDAGVQCISASICDLPLEPDAPVTSEDNPEQTFSLKRRNFLESADQAERLVWWNAFEEPERERLLKSLRGSMNSAVQQGAAERNGSRCTIQTTSGRTRSGHEGCRHCGSGWKTSSKHGKDAERHAKVDSPVHR